MVFGAFFSMALISIPTLMAFAKLGDSVKKLFKVYSEEVPGTLRSLKLSGLELNDLTQQLSTIGVKFLVLRLERRMEAVSDQDPLARRTQLPKIGKNA